jgi:hypothetical protein
MSEETLRLDAPKDAVLGKEELEREKLLLEIEQLKEPWWKKPVYMLAALPTLLAALSLIYGFANGYFQATATKLENQRHDLQVQKDKLEADVKEVAATKEKLALQVEQLERTREVYEEEAKMADEAYRRWSTAEEYSNYREKLERANHKRR